MMDPHSPPKALFKDSQLSSYLELVSRNAESEVAAIPREQLVDIGIEEVAETLLAKIAPRAPLLRLDKRYALEPREIQVKVQDKGHEVLAPATLMTIAIPFEGDRNLFFVTPGSASKVSFPTAAIADSEILLSFEFVTAHLSDGVYQNRIADPRAWFDYHLELIDRFLTATRTEIEAFLPLLRKSIHLTLQKRSHHLASAIDAFAAVGIPVRRNSGRDPATRPGTSFDAFISYASEDRDFAAALAKELGSLGFKVWFAEQELTVGDRLNESINGGLKEARYGIVILSTHSLVKAWPQYELGGLLAREMQGQKVVLPVWHNISKEQVLARQPALVNRLALSIPPMSLPEVVSELSRALSEQS